MGIIETTIAIVLAQIPMYFIQRYFFKKVMDKHLDKLEERVRTKITPKETIRKLSEELGNFTKRETTIS